MKPPVPLATTRTLPFAPVLNAQLAALLVLLQALRAVLPVLPSTSLPLSTSALPVILFATSAVGLETRLAMRVPRASSQSMALLSPV